MFFLAFRRNAQPREQWTVTLAQHLEWMERQHREGTIWMSGPTPDRSTGIYLIKASSRAEAEQIAGADPYTAAGHCTFELIEWNLHQMLGFGNFEAGGPRPETR